MNGSANSSTNDEALTFRPTATGTHFIGVSNDAGSSTEVPYVLHISRDSIWSTAFSCPDDQYEPNNSFAQAATLTTTGVYALASCPGANLTQDDYYQFVAPSAGTAKISIMYDSTDLALSVRAVSGNITTVPYLNNRHTYSKAVNQGEVIEIWIANGGTRYGAYFMNIELE
jgi:hypothetical protein